MKKLNYLMLGLAGLAMASCSQDDLQAPGQADGNYIVTVKLPSNLGTRAAVNMNTGYTANDLFYAVYDAEDNSLVQWNQTKFTEAASGALETQVGLNLATGKSYKISFFACAPDNKVYTFDATAKTMTVNYEEMTSAGTEENDIYDCFINLLETKEIGSTQMQASVTLYRPIAQINWGTSDLDEPSIQKAYGVDGQYILSNLSTDAYYTWNLLDNDVDKSAGTVPVEFKEEFTQPQSATGLAPFPVTGYKYVAMQYVLAPKTEAIYDLNLNITNEGVGNPDPSTLTSDVEVSSAPVQANYQTNIYGSLLTDNVIVNVVKSPGWGGQYNNAVEVTSADDFTNALNEGKSVVLTEDITVPSSINFTNDADIHLNKHTLNLGSPSVYNVTNGSEITILDGNLNFTGKSGAAMDMMVKEGAKLTLDGVNITTTAAGLNAQQDHAGLIIKNCTFTGPYYSISTNASGTTGESGGDYGKGGEITLISSTFTSTGGTPLMNNVPETVSATDCIFNGKIQAAFIRGGNATFDGCTFNLSRTMATNPFRLVTWSQGNAACLAGIVGGNYITNTNETNPSYNYPTIITLTGKTVINIEGNYADTTPGIHLCSAYRNVVTFNYDPSDVTINYPESVILENGYYPIEFGTLDITVNGSLITTATEGYVGPKN